MSVDDDDVVMTLSVDDDVITPLFADDDDVVVDNVLGRG